MNILTLGKPRMIPGATHGLMQQALIVDVQVELSSPSVGLISWINLCLPELSHSLPNYSTECSKELNTENIAQWLALLASVLQRQYDEPVGWGKAFKTEVLDHYELAIPVHNKLFGYTALDVAYRIIQEGFMHDLANEVDKDVLAESLQVRIKKQFAHIGPRIHQNNLGVLRAAERMNIPWLRFAPQIYQLGYGCKAHRTRKAYYTDNTTMMGVIIAHTKPLTTALLAQAGLPVPKQGGIAKSLEECFAIAEQLGYPVVLKPVASGKGRGVTPGIKTQEELLNAYNFAKGVGQNVLIEKHIEGKDYRLMVVGGHLIAATNRIAARVLGDGIHTIRELIDLANLERGPRSLLVRLVLDHRVIDVLAEEGFTPESIPESGQFVSLRRQTNGHAGGTSTDVLNKVHPDNRLMAERAARTVGLDVAGIDFLTPDISRSYLEVGGAINEVNRSPGLITLKIANPHRDYEGEIVEWMLGGSNGRIPIAAITGINSTTGVSHLLHHILLHQGVLAGLSTTQGAWIGKHAVSNTELNGYQGGWIVLTDRTVEAAVIELPHQGLIDAGCPFDQCDVVALLDSPDTTTMRFEIDILKRAQHAIVVNAEHPTLMNQVEAIGENILAKHIILVAQDSSHPAVQKHLAAGGSAVLKTEDEKPGLFLHTGHSSQQIIALQEMSAAVTTVHTAIDTLFAIALAYTMNYSPDQIRAGLSNLINTAKT